MAVYTCVDSKSIQIFQIHLICMPPSSENFCDKSSQFHFVNDYLYKETEDSNNQTKSYVQRYYPISQEAFDPQATGTQYEEQHERSPPKIATKSLPLQNQYDFNDFSGLSDKGHSSSVVPLNPRYYSYDDTEGSRDDRNGDQNKRNPIDGQLPHSQSDHYEQYSF